MIVRRSGMKKILSFFSTYKIFLPYDIDFSLPEGIAFYTVKKDVIGHTKFSDTISDNGGPFYLKKKKKEEHPDK